MRTDQHTILANVQEKTELIYRAYSRLMFHEAYAILRHTQDAEDAVQQAFLKIAEHIETVNISQEKKLRNLVVTVSKNCAIDIFRKKKCYPSLSLDVVKNTADVSNDGNSFAYCMDELSEQERKILLLKYDFGYTSKEISKILDISEASAYKANQRARKKLEAVCRKQGLL